MMTEIAVPVPARFWWLKRLTAVGLLVFIFLLGVRLWWEHVAQQQLDAEIDAARARGEPALIDDFNSPAADVPPDAQNAAVQLNAAAISVSYNAAQTAFDNHYTSNTAMTDVDRKLLYGLVVANAKAIALSRVAADLPRVDWQLKVQSPVSAILLPALNSQRGLANLMRYAAIDHHLHGDDAQTVEDLRDLFRQSDVGEQYGPFMVTHLVGIGISALAADSVSSVAGDLKIGQNGASQEQIRRLIGQILDEREYQWAGENIFYGERLLATDSNGAIPFITPRPNLTVPAFIQPMLTLDIARVFAGETAMAHAMREPTYLAALAKFPPAPNRNGLSPLRTISHVYSTMIMPSFSKLVITHFRGLMDRRAAALLLAIRLYEVDHGAPPAKLDLLVPDYLPAIPIDPFASDGHMMRYIATPGAEAVYSVGQNGRDDGGSMQPLRPVHGRPPVPWEMLDAVFLLHPAPLLPPATEPAQ
jgi:hypothetical protein